MKRILTTAEMAKASGHTVYDLRLGANEGRYPVIWIGGKNSQRKRMGWNLDVFLEWERQQMMNNCQVMQREGRC